MKNVFLASIIFVASLVSSDVFADNYNLQKEARRARAAHEKHAGVIPQEALKKTNEYVKKMRPDIDLSRKWYPSEDGFTKSISMWTAHRVVVTWDGKILLYESWWPDVIGRWKQ